MGSHTVMFCTGALECLTSVVNSTAVSCELGRPGLGEVSSKVPVRQVYMLTSALGYACVLLLLLYLFSVYFAIQTWEGITETIFDYVFCHIYY